MSLFRAGCLLAWAFVLSRTAAAEPQIDPRYPFTLEPSGDAGIYSSFGSVGTSQFVYGGALVLGVPIGEARQLVVGGAAATGHSNTGTAFYGLGFVGYRILTFADPWRTRLDLALAADDGRFSVTGVPGVSATPHGGFGLGPRLAVAIQYYFNPWIGLGPELNAAFLLVTTQVIGNVALALTVNW